MAKESQVVDAGAARWAVPMLVVICGAVAYCGSFSGPFVFDDHHAIVENPRVRGLVPQFGKVRDPHTLSGRWVTEYSFTVQYAVAGLNLAVCHGVNLAIHLSCGLLLYGIVRRTLSNRGLWGDRFLGSECWVAGAVAVIWVVHPLNTMAVTYIVQRVESLAALFYLAVIYCLIRWVEDRRVGWAVVGVAACALGMGSKETMVTAPVMALLFDRTFLSGSFKEALKRRWMFYAGLGATWAVLGLMLAMNGRGQSAGIGQGLGVMDYARTQLDVIAHYLRLAIWPSGLVFDAFDWPVTREWQGVSAGGWMVLGLEIGTAIALWRKPWLGFLGAWVFVILSPTSSVVPIVTEVAAEQRMYMPLMAIVVLVVVAGWAMAERRQAWKLAGGAAAVVAVVLMGTTMVRNRVFASEEGLWRDVIARRPNNARAHYALGAALVARGDLAAGTEELETALKIKPDYYPVVHWLGQAWLDQGKTQEAEEFCDRQIASKTAIAPEAHFLRGSMRMKRRDWNGAREDFAAVIVVYPDVADAHYSLGLVMEEEREWKRAEGEFDRAVQLEPENQAAVEHLMRVIRAENGEK